MEAIAFRKATEIDIEKYRTWFGQDTPQSELLMRFAELPDEHPQTLAIASAVATPNREVRFDFHALSSIGSAIGSS